MLRFLGTSAPTILLPLGLLLAAAWGGAAACGGSTGAHDGATSAAGRGDDTDDSSDVADDGGSDDGGSDDVGTGGGPDVGPCLSESCQGRCVGTSCDGSWSCEPDVVCTDDLREYCGCDGVTFTGSGTCPTRAYAHEGACEALDCDPAHVTCEPLVPPEPCEEGQVHSVVDGCYGACVPIASCGCSATQACPDEAHYVCHASRGRCDYYVQ